MHANLAASNGKEELRQHYKELIDKGLDAKLVELVVTDMLEAYKEVIVELFPNALHQYCIFHFIQHINKLFKEALKVHRQANFAQGERKEAHLIALLMLKGQEHLSDQERIVVLNFCEQYPSMAANYALKEDIRFLYANAQSREQAYAYKDIIVELYSASISLKMSPTIAFLNDNFEQSIAYLKNGYFLDKTNNDAERMMRTIKRTQQTHYFLRNENNYIKKIRVVLGIQIPIAA